METGVDTLAEAIRRQFGLEKQDIRTCSPLTLAYIGDSIYDLITVRPQLLIKTIRILIFIRGISCKYLTSQCGIDNKPQHTDRRRYQKYMLQNDQDSLYKRSFIPLSFHTYSLPNASISFLSYIQLPTLLSDTLVPSD